MARARCVTALHLTLAAAAWTFADSQQTPSPLLRVPSSLPPARPLTGQRERPVAIGRPRLVWAVHDRAGRVAVGPAGIQRTLQGSQEGHTGSPGTPLRARPCCGERHLNAPAEAGMQVCSKVAPQSRPACRCSARGVWRQPRGAAGRPCLLAQRPQREAKKVVEQGYALAHAGGVVKGDLPRERRGGPGLGGLGGA